MRELKNKELVNVYGASGRGYCGGGGGGSSGSGSGGGGGSGGGSS